MDRSSQAAAPAAGRRFSCCTAGRGWASTTSAISPTSSRRRTTSPGTSSEAAPSAAEGPYTVATDVDDARRVLDALGWDKAWVVGHSWGGHLALHVAEALPERLFGALAVDPLGSVGDGRWPEFDEEIFRRTPAEVRARARELDALMMEGAVDEELALEGMRLVWPAYFADPEQAPPMPELRMASERSAQMVPSILAELPALEAGLPRIRVPVGFVHGSQSPMPVATSTDAADRIPGAWVDVVDGAGHFVWVEAPGAVRTSLRRLTAARSTFCPQPPIKDPWISRSFPGDPSACCSSTKV